MIRLIACDLDGTLLRDKPPVFERNRKALDRAQAAGINIVVVSARHPRDVRGVVTELRVSGPGICINGALIYDFAADRVMKYDPLSPETIQSVVRKLREHVPGMMFHWEQEATFGREPAYELDSTGLLETVSELLDDTVVLTTSSPLFLEISAAGVHKGAALQWLSGEFGTEPDEVIAFGDMPNDIPMLTWAGRGVAMGNAHASVKAIADEVTAANLEDGVALVLERILDDQEGLSTRSRKSTAFG